MTLVRATYCTREDVLSALQLQQSPRIYNDVDRAIASATRNIDGRCHRTFHPVRDTREFLWPEPNQSARSWVFWLDANELISLETLTSGGAVIPPSGYYLEPAQYGPPYSRIETNQASVSAFASGSGTQQRSLVALGLFGYDNVTRAATVLAGAIASTSVATLTVADGSQVGVGDLLLIDTERLIVTGRAWVTTGQTLLTPMTASAANRSVVVTSGAALHVGEVLQLDAEQMLVTDIIGNTAYVDRAVNATPLAVHTGSTVYSPRALTVVRGANGSTAATHLDTTTVNVQVVPGPVRSLGVGESLVELQQLTAGYARTAGSGDNERTIGSGPGLNDLRDQVETSFRRKVRSRAV
jgi:hypothetical protein